MHAESIDGTVSPLCAAGANTGEWMLCDMPQPCLVFSVGVGGDWGFEKAAAAAGCETHAFDPTEELKAQHVRTAEAFQRSKTQASNISFHFQGLGSEHTRDHFARSTQSRQYGSHLGSVAHLDTLFQQHARGRFVHALKIDCEGCEWDEFAHLAAAAPETLRSVGLLMLEVHMSPTLGLTHDTQQEGGAAEAVRRLFDLLFITHGFRVVQMRANAGSGADRSSIPASLRRHATQLPSNVCCYNLMLRRPATA